MALVLLVIAGIVALSLVAAALGKAMVFDRAKNTIATMGVPSRVAKPFLISLILAEIVTALLLLIPDLRSAGAILAMLMLGSFTGVLLGNWAVGNKVACNCFGGSANRPFGWVALSRNLTLAILAGLLLILERSIALPQLGMLVLVSVVMGLAGFAYVVLRLTRRQESIHDSTSPSFHAQPVTGHRWVGQNVADVLRYSMIPDEMVGLSRKQSGLFVVFLSASCPSCDNVKEMLRSRLRRERPVIFICHDQDTVNSLSSFEGMHIGYIIEDFSSRLMQEFNFDLLPTAIAIEESTVVSWAVGEKEIGEMLSESRPLNTTSIQLKEHATSLDLQASR